MSIKAPKHFFVVATVLVFAYFGINYFITKPRISGAPPYGESQSSIPDLDPYKWLKNWKRPKGPVRVGLQVGHLKNSELPSELSKLIGNTGSSGGGKTEIEVNNTIVLALARLLEKQGISVDILPATIPPDYWADAFIAIHADGSTDTSASGYKIAAPWRDFTQKADILVTFLETEYGSSISLPKDPNISKNMRGYYAFSWWRYDHAIHPMTPAAIVETGFLTNPLDRKIIVNQPDLVASSLSQGIIKYLQSQDLI